MTENVQADSPEELDFSIPEDEPEQAEQQEEEESHEAPDSPPEEVEQEPKQEESSVIRDMRKQLREKERKLKELESKQSAPREEQAQDPGEMPDIEQFDYDGERYKAAVHKWHADKLKFDRANAANEAKQTEVLSKYQSALTEYKANAAKIKDFDQAEQDVAGVLSVDQQNTLLLKAPKEAHRIVLALSRNPDRLERLASIKDPVDFGIELGKLQALAQSAPRPKAKSVKAEREIKGHSGTSVQSLDRLKKAAQESGDYTAYYAAKRLASAKK